MSNPSDCPDCNELRTAGIRPQWSVHCELSLQGGGISGRIWTVDNVCMRCAIYDALHFLAADRLQPHSIRVERTNG